MHPRPPLNKGLSVNGTPTRTSQRDALIVVLILEYLRTEFAFDTLWDNAISLTSEYFFLPRATNVHARLDRELGLS